MSYCSSSIIPLSLLLFPPSLPLSFPLLSLYRSLSLEPNTDRRTTYPRTSSLAFWTW